jgi:hypothetical protein
VIRCALLAVLVGSLAVDAAPGPMPREVRLDGDILPEGALARLGSSRFREIYATRIALSPDGSEAICSDATSVRTWDLKSGKLLRVSPLPEYFIGPVSEDGTIAVQLREGGADVWDVRTGRSRRTLALKGVTWFDAAAIAPDGWTIATTDHTRDEIRVHLWDLRIGKSRLVCHERSDSSYVGIAFVAEGKQLLLWFHTDNSLASVRISDGKEVYRLKDVPFVLPSPGGSRFLADVDGKHHEVFDGATGRLLYKEPRIARLDGFRPIALAQDGTRLVFESTRGDDSKQDEVGVWDYQRGMVLARYPTSGVLAAFGRHNELVLTNWDGLHVIDAATGRKLTGVDPSRAFPARTCAFGWYADDRFSASDHKKETRMWLDPATGKVLRRAPFNLAVPAGRLSGCRWPDELRSFGENWDRSDEQGNRQRYIGCQDRGGFLTAVRPSALQERSAHDPPYTVEWGEEPNPLYWVSENRLPPGPWQLRV